MGSPKSNVYFDLGNRLIDKPWILVVNGLCGHDRETLMDDELYTLFIFRLSRPMFRLSP